MLALAKRDLVLFGRDPPTISTCRERGCISAPRVRRCMWSMSRTGATANPPRKDLYDAARLTHALDNVHFFQRAMVCRDVVDNFEMDSTRSMPAVAAPPSMSAPVSPTRRMLRAAWIFCT
jgi:trimethylamine--corrinoid protein Co-methyltransferase